MSSFKDRYVYLKSIGRCTKCGKRESMSNNTRCWECNEKRYDYVLTDSQKRDKNAKAKQLKLERKENNECTTCGKKLDIGYTFITCQMCRYKSRKNKESEARVNGVLSRKMKKDLGICNLCSEKAMTNKRLCEKHYALALSALEIGRSKKGKEKWSGEIGGYFRSNKKKSSI